MDNPPVLSSGLPDGELVSGTAQTVMSIATDEIATCRYSEVADTPYSAMVDTFFATGGTTHFTIMSGLEDGHAYNYYIKCEDAEGNADKNDYAISFSVLSGGGDGIDDSGSDTTPPVLSSGLPSGALASGTVQTVMSIATDEIATCKYSNVAGTTYSAMADAFFATGGTTHFTIMAGLVEGSTYNYYVRCEDAHGNAGGNDYAISFTVGAAGAGDGGGGGTDGTGGGGGTDGGTGGGGTDGGTGGGGTDGGTGGGGGSSDTTPPVLSSGYPMGGLGSGTVQTVMSVTTDEAATCKYSSASGTSYSSMSNTFSTTGGTAHSTSITGLQDGGQYTRYVRCMDAAGNENTSDYQISFYVASDTAGPDGAPKLFFSDLTSGPKTGWEGSSTKGAAVTVWGKNLGSSRGSSYVTVNGATLSSDSDYAEWGTTGTANGIPRGLARITFWLKSGCADGAGNITVTVDGMTSNALPFTVRAGNIYFVSVTSGNDSNNGKYASAQSGSNGPWKSPRMALHSNNSIITPGDTIYLRAGTYTQSSIVMDEDGTFIRGRCDYGTANMPLAVVGYPGEMPLFDFETFSGTRRGIFGPEPGTYNGAYGVCNLGHGADYFVFSKLKAMHATDLFGIWGVGNRIIGNYFKDNNLEAWSGLIMVYVSQDTHIYGNYFEHNGYDMYKHNIYIKTHLDFGNLVPNLNEAEYVYVGWNEFARWTADLNSDAYTKPSRGGAVEVQTESTAWAAGRSTNHVYIHDNYFHDGDSQALYLTEATYYYVYNNIISNLSCQFGGLAVANAGGESRFYNNIFYHTAPASVAMMGMASPSASTYPQWKNNVFFAYSGQSYFDTESPFNSDHDLFFGNGAPSGGNYNVTSPIVADPLFMNPGSGDFSLQAGSPAIDAGSSAVGPVVTKDYDGDLRPAGGGYDIGVYEY